MLKRIIAFLLTAAAMLTASCAAAGEASAAYGTPAKQNHNGCKVAYIPLDNRPVNYDRAEFLAQQSGIDLLMPAENLFRTALDNMKKNPNGTTYGDREALVEWLKETDKTCDIFVLSLDQLLSGGLVSSRWLSNTDLTLEYSIADYIIELSETNTVILFDTVMRLASTVNYQGYQYDKYTLFRTYGMQRRAELTGNDLTVENIISGYKYSPDGEVIETTLSESEIDGYLASRARKLKLIDYILSASIDNVEYCYIGVDDSSTTSNIQTNEIRYITEKLGDKGMLFAGTDELGLMGLTKAVSLLYGTTDVCVTYYGGGENNIADSFDFATLKQEVEYHVTSLGNGITDSADALQVLVLTSRNTASAAVTLAKQAAKNCENGIPTIVIDPTSGSADHALQRALIDQNVPLTVLLGYSSWNTAANSIGIALSNGISRYIYLANSSVITDESHEGFLKAATFSYVKDICYRNFGYSISNLGVTGDCSYNEIYDSINSSKMIVSLDTYLEVSHGKVSGSKYRYPWDRTFEMTFEISVEDSAYALSGDVNGDGAITAADYLMAKRIVLGTYNADASMIKRGDVNRNGGIDATDYLMIKRHFLGTYVII